MVKHSHQPDNTADYKRREDLSLTFSVAMHPSDMWPMQKSEWTSLPEVCKKAVSPFQFVIITQSERDYELYLILLIMFLSCLVPPSTWENLLHRWRGSCTALQRSRWGGTAGHIFQVSTSSKMHLSEPSSPGALSSQRQMNFPQGKILCVCILSER